MENRLYYIDLYDYYSELLTDKQRNYFEEYYFDNLTLSEMSENYNVSRNAVSKQLISVVEKLDYYENKLRLYQKSKKIKKIIENLDEKIKEEIESLL